MCHFFVLRWAVSKKEVSFDLHVQEDVYYTNTDQISFAENRSVQIKNNKSTDRHNLLYMLFLRSICAYKA